MNRFNHIKHLHTSISTLYYFNRFKENSHRENSHLEYSHPFHWLPFFTEHFVRKWGGGMYLNIPLSLDKKFEFLRWQGQLTGAGGTRGQFTWENSACTIVINTKLSTKKCYWIPRGVWLCLLLLLYYWVIQHLKISFFTSVNKSTN